MFKCINCGWKGNELSKQSSGAMWNDKCPVCGDEVIALSVENKLSKVEPEHSEKIKFDFNNDGVVDSKDRKVAARLLGSKKGKQRKGVR